MVQGDEAWCALAAIIADEDRDSAARYNARAVPDQHLGIEAGAVPFVGAITTAPIVLLLSQPTPDDLPPSGTGSHLRAGWPLAALHPVADVAAGTKWRLRLRALVEEFGAQHVANSVAAVYLTPWRGRDFDPGLRLPSRGRQLGLAAAAAARDAILVMAQSSYLWTEQPDVAALPPARCVQTRSWRRAELSAQSLGDAWPMVCRRVATHAWI